MKSRKLRDILCENTQIRRLQPDVMNKVMMVIDDDSNDYDRNVNIIGMVIVIGKIKHGNIKNGDLMILMTMLTGGLAKQPDRLLRDKCF